MRRTVRSYATVRERASRSAWQAAKTACTPGMCHHPAWRATLQRGALRAWHVEECS